MTSEYTTKRVEIVKQIILEKNIHKLRQFFNSADMKSQRRYVEISQRFLQNELQGGVLDSSEQTAEQTARQTALKNLIAHWQWALYDNNSINWWNLLVANHSKSASLEILVKLWIDDSEPLDISIFEQFAQVDVAQVPEEDGKKPPRLWQ